jgi:GPH family glycoside/pentoside/hexuronide:cation symporter
MSATPENAGGRAGVAGVAPPGAAATPAARSGWTLHLGWGIGTLGAALLLNGFSFMALFYLTTEIGIGAALAGTLLAIAKLWDVVANPTLGWLSDRTDTRWGRRRPYLLVGGLVSGLSFAFLFSLADTPFKDSLPVVFLALVLVGTGYTLFNVPYMAMPAEMISDYHERSKLTAYRVFFVAIGTVIGGAAAKKLVESFGGGTEGFADYGMLVGALIFVFMAVTFFGTAGAPASVRTTTTLPALEQLKLGFANRPFAALLWIKLTQLMGLASGTATAIFVVQYVMQKPKPGDWILLLGLVATSVQILAIPLWLRISRKLDKPKTYAIATVIYVCTVLTWWLSGPDETVWQFGARAAVQGFTAAGLLLMGQSMLPDAIEYDYRRTGLRREGVFSGLYSVVEKFAFAIAPAIVGFTLAWWGFEPKSAHVGDAAVQGVRVAAAFLPSTYFALSLIGIALYGLNEKALKSMPLPEKKG